MVEITFRDSEYHVESKIYFDISTNDFSKVHEMLQVEYESQFADAIRKTFTNHTLVKEKLK